MDFFAIQMDRFLICTDISLIRTAQFPVCTDLFAIR